MASVAGADGLWNAEANDDEGSIKVTISPYDADSAKTYGKIWGPEDNKNHSSKMNLKGETLDVEGCVTIICSRQHWNRVNPLLAGSDAGPSVNLTGDYRETIEMLEPRGSL